MLLLIWDFFSRKSELTEKSVESTADLVWIFVKGEFQFHACLDFNIMQRELY